MSKINYDLSRIKAFVFDVDGVLSPNTVPMTPDGLPARMLNVKDGFALRQAVLAGYRIAIITGADSEAIVRRMANIGIADVCLRAADKLPILNSWMADNGLSPDEVAYAGDDVPDMECLAAVGLSVAPADADADVRDRAVFVTTCDGGHGVARQLIQETMLAQGKWPSSAKAYWTPK